MFRGLTNPPSLMSLRFSLLVGAALALSPLASAQSSLTPGSTSDVPYVGTASSFGGLALTQSVDPLTVSGGIVACSVAAEASTVTNGFWRVFDLATAAPGGPFAAASVDMGIRVSASNGLDSLQVFVGTLPAGTDVSSTFSRDDVTEVGSSDLFAVTAGQTALLNIPVTGTVPAGTLMSIELRVPTGRSADPESNPGADVRAGTNTLGETAPTYLSSDDCGGIQPTATADVASGFPGNWVLTVNGMLSVASENGITQRSVSIGSAQPNPVANTAKVPFTLESSVAVRASVYDLLGREVAKLADGSFAAGEHTLDLNAADLPAGAYVVRLQAGDAVVTQMVTVVR